MTDRYHPKPPDYSVETAQSLISGNELRPNFYSKSNDLIEFFYRESLEYTKSLNSDSQSSIYIGYTGVALTHFMIHLRTKRPGSLEITKQLTNMALRKLNKRRVSFLQGDAGPLALSAAINLYENNPHNVGQYIEKLVSLGEHAKNQDFEVLNGWSGYLYALLYVNTFVDGAIPHSVIRKCVEKIIFEGFNFSKKSNSPTPLAYRWDDTNYYGAAHGVAGILYMLLCSGVVSHSEIHSLIKPTLDYLIQTRLPSGNFRSSEDSRSDTLVQWCHGAPGFIDLLILAAEVFGGPRYMQYAEAAADVVWARGLLKKGYSICHGVCGNAYSFLSLYRKTMSQEQLYRAAMYFHWTLTYPEYEGYKPDRPHSLFEGKAGTLYFLVDMAQPVKAMFPCYALT